MMSLGFYICHCRGSVDKGHPSDLSGTLQTFASHIRACSLVSAELKSEDCLNE
jgi:hypothetical protein